MLSGCSLRADGKPGDLTIETIVGVIHDPHVVIFKGALKSRDDFDVEVPFCGNFDPIVAGFPLRVIIEADCDIWWHRIEHQRTRLIILTIDRGILKVNETVSCRQVEKPC
jgi:hypothetical protein